MNHENKSADMSLAARCITGVDARWPVIKYLSLAFYAAWILLTMTSGATLGTMEGSPSGRYNAILYLLSGIPLATCLLLAGVFHKQVRKIVGKDIAIIAASVLAGICTFLVASGFATTCSFAVFIAASIGTGLGTSLLCLRIGCVYSDMTRGNPFLITATACLLSNLLYFMCVGISGPLKDITISLLPLIAALCSCVNAQADGQIAQAEEERIPVKKLSKGYLPKLFISVFMMCISIGAIRGLAGLLHTSDAVAWESNLCVFFSFVVLTVIVVVYAAVLAVKNFEISKIYFPIIIATASIVVVCLLLGQYVDALKSIVVNTSYNIFIVVIWCILQDIAYRTNIGSVRAYGFGRGVSAAGTTLGWMIAMTVTESSLDPASAIPAVFVITAVLVLVAAALLLSEGTISIALMRGYGQIASAPREHNEQEIAERETRSFEDACSQIAEEMSLTAREAQTLELLGRGRTIGFVAEELGISYNTVKGYTKNVYAKCNVHSRQELIDEIEHRLS